MSSTGKAGERACIRCGQPFKPAKPHYRYCDACNRDTTVMGWTKINSRANAAAHRHGGVSRLRTDRRSVVLQGNITCDRIMKALEKFLTDLYQRPMNLYTLMAKGGLAKDAIHTLKDDRHLTSLVMDFCPSLREWLIEKLDHTSTDLLIGFYGLYGDEPVPVAQLAHNLGLAGEEHGRNRQWWALRHLRNLEWLQELEKLAVNAARKAVKNG